MGDSPERRMTAGGLLGGSADKSTKKKKTKKGLTPKPGTSAEGDANKTQDKMTLTNTENSMKKSKKNNKKGKTKGRGTKDDGMDCLPEHWKPSLSSECEVAVEAFMKYHMTLGVTGLRDEFVKWKTWVPPTFTFEAFNANLEKNRYRDVVCLDHTRISLTLMVPPETDYIHANLVKMEGCDKAFITTQGPLESTIGDHWRLVHQEGVSCIIVLCQFVEAGKAKCTQYWPVKEGEQVTYGKMGVNTRKVFQDSGFDVYTVEALPDGCSNSTICKLIHMTAWPDRGVPADPKTILRLLRLMYNNGQGGLLVHCSAGIGRTGVIVGIDFLINRLIKGQTTKMLDVFQTLRSQRASTIQTEGQYVFVVQAVMEWILIRTGNKYESLIKKFNEDVVKAAIT